MTDHKPSINVDKVQLLCLGMRSKGIKAALITQTHNYSWLTDGGRSWVGLATENATAIQLLIVDSEPTKVIALTNSIEAERVKAEEGACVEGGLQVLNAVSDAPATLCPVLTECIVICSSKW
eukprot:2124177-Rhodomonas_salina.2